jgi:hypothetical protein
LAAYALKVLIEILKKNNFYSSIIKIMDNHGDIRGKTYTLLNAGQGSQGYYVAIRKAVDMLLESIPDENKLLSLIRASHKRSLLHNLTKGRRLGELAYLVNKTLHDQLSVFTKDVDKHLRGLDIKDKVDPVLSTRQWQYHLYMAEIELVNRIYADKFREASYKFALIGHCLRDFRPECQAEAGDVEEVCQGCTEDCFVNIGSDLMVKYGIHPYISVEMEQESLFRQIKSRHQNVGALGIACVPELARGMRLCIKLGIPPVGVPLDANRCSRWLGYSGRSSFDLRELENLIKG